MSSIKLHDVELLMREEFQGMMSHSLAIKESMKQFSNHFYFKLLCNKMFYHRIFLLIMAVFVTLTKGYLLSSLVVKLLSPTLPEPLKVDFLNRPNKPCSHMQHLGKQHLDRSHHGKPRLTLQSKTRKEARMMWWKWRLGRSSRTKMIGLRCWLVIKSGFIKVSKFQKQYFLKQLHCPKTDELLDKILLYEARAEFWQIFCSFFGQWIFKKKCFWDLLTLR